MPNPINPIYGNLLTVQETKDLLYDLVNFLDFDDTGVSSMRRAFYLIWTVGKSDYFGATNNSGLAKRIKTHDPKLYERLQIFFLQNDLSADEDDE